ncbi:hypothetical protein [Sphingomonas endophytica]
MLRTALGPAIAGFLEDPTVVEVMLNPDGRLWIDRLSEGLSDTGECLSAADVMRHQAHDTLALGGGQALSRIRQPLGQAVNPEPSARV